MTARVCSAPGCAVLVSRGRCPLHEQSYQKRKNEHYDAERPKVAQRGYGAQHRRWRDAILKRDPICKMCGKAKSTVADHIVPLRLGGTWSYSNGQGLCATDHQVKRQRESTEARGGTIHGP